MAETNEHLARNIPKRDLWRHINQGHPEHIYPKGALLAKWRLDELHRLHDELHGLARYGDLAN